MVLFVTTVLPQHMARCLRHWKKLPVRGLGVQVVFSVKHHVFFIDCWIANTLWGAVCNMHTFVDRSNFV